MSELMEFISEFTGEGGSLPLVHTTDSFRLQLIRKSGKLEATEDKVYAGENLVYMFYGRPSFRVNSDVKHTSSSFFAPVCLIFSRDLLGSAHRIMPFDSGAHAAGLLQGTIHKQMSRDNFELEVHPQSPVKLIKCFYGSEAAYLENSPKSDAVNVQNLQNDHKHYVEAYYHLVHHKSNESTDERVNAVEVQFDKDIPLEGNIQAVILPSRFFLPELVTTIEKELGATAILYNMPASFKPSELMNTIYEKVLSFIVESRGVSVA